MSRGWIPLFPNCIHAAPFLPTPSVQWRSWQDDSILSCSFLLLGDSMQPEYLYTRRTAAVAQPLCTLSALCTLHSALCTL